MASMFSLFKEIRILRDEGKLHEKLLKRNRVLFAISIILLLVTIANIALRGTSSVAIIGCTVLVVGGFLLGYFLFSQMSAVGWDEEKEVVIVEKMDKVGYATLALYVIFEVTFRTYLKHHFSADAVPLLLSAISGTLLGRAVGTLAEIHRVYLHNHPRT
jgi:hypothetical protein